MMAVMVAMLKELLRLQVMSPLLSVQVEAPLPRMEAHLLLPVRQQYLHPVELAVRAAVLVGLVPEVL
jgi:hypothetical protein